MTPECLARVTLGREELASPAAYYEYIQKHQVELWVYDAKAESCVQLSPGFLARFDKAGCNAMWTCLETRPAAAWCDASESLTAERRLKDAPPIAHSRCGRARKSGGPTVCATSVQPEAPRSPRSASVCARRHRCHGVLLALPGTVLRSGGRKPPCTPRHAMRPCGPVRFKAAARRQGRCPSGSLEPASPARLADDALPAAAGNGWGHPPRGLQARRAARFCRRAEVPAMASPEGEGPCHCALGVGWRASARDARGPLPFVKRTRYMPQQAAWHAILMV